MQLLLAWVKMVKTASGTEKIGGRNVFKKFENYQFLGVVDLWDRDVFYGVGDRIYQC